MFIFNSKCLFLTSAIDPPPIEEASVSMAGMAFIAWRGEGLLDYQNINLSVLVIHYSLSQD